VHIGQHTCDDVPTGEPWLLSDLESNMVQRFDPGGSDDTIGFFVAAFQKNRTLL
jgi:hypothetical protein